MSWSNMRLVALAVVCGLMVGQDGASGGSVDLPRYDATQRTRATGSVLLSEHRRSGSSSAAAAAAAAAAADFVSEEPSLCFSLRENEEPRLQLLCNDRRSKFNFNPFGLRFGKRYSYRRAVTRARTNKISPLSVFSRELEVPT